MATFDIPPWLQQPADPPSAILRGAQAGGIIAQSRQRDRQLDMQAREMAAQERAQQQDLQLRGLKMAEYLRNRDDEIQARATMMELDDTVAGMLETGEYEGARNFLLGKSARNPMLLNFPQMTNLLKEVDAAIKQKGVQAQLESMERRAFNAEEGRDYRAELYADNRLEVAQAKAALDNDPNNLVAQQRLLRAYMQMEGLQQGRERIGIAKENLGLRNNAAVQSAVRTEAQLATDGLAPAIPLAPQGTLPPGPGGAQPATGLVVPSTTPRPLTTGAATAIQAGLQKDLAAVTSLDEAIDAATAHPEAFGIQGKVRRIGEQVKGQLKPGEPMETPITDTQQKAGLAFSSIAQSLKVDSQLNRDELKMLKDIGDTMDFKEGPQTALQKLNNLRSLSYRNTVRKAKQLGQLSSAIQSLPRKALVELWKSGDLTAEQVRAESARRDTGAGPAQIEQFMRGEP